jgi:hypothetical protein
MALKLLPLVPYRREAFSEHPRKSKETPIL